jgi:hypothetical protein
MSIPSENVRRNSNIRVLDEVSQNLGGKRDVRRFGSHEYVGPASTAGGKSNELLQYEKIPLPPH